MQHLHLLCIIQSKTLASPAHFLLAMLLVLVLTMLADISQVQVATHFNADIMQLIKNGTVQGEWPAARDEW